MIYLSYYFTNLLKVHPGLCNHEFVITVRCVYRTVWIFCLALSSAALFGVAQQGGFYYHIPPHVSSMVHIMPIVFLFYRVWSTTTWTLREIIERSTLLLRVSTRCWCVWRFWRWSKVVWVNYGAPCANYIERVCSNLLMISFVSSLDVGLQFSSRRAYNAHFSCILWLSVVITSRRLALGFVTSLQHLGIFLPAFFFLSSTDNKGLSGRSYFISDGILFNFRIS